MKIQIDLIIDREMSILTFVLNRSFMLILDWYSIYRKWSIHMIRIILFKWTTITSAKQRNNFQGLFCFLTCNSCHLCWLISFGFITPIHQRKAAPAIKYLAQLFFYMLILFYVTSILILQLFILICFCILNSCNDRL